VDRLRPGIGGKLRRGSRGLRLGGFFCLPSLLDSSLLNAGFLHASFLDARLRNARLRNARLFGLRYFLPGRDKLPGTEV
jgi:hypothetical protein